MGYKTELEDRRSDALNSHPLVAQPKVLTDRSMYKFLIWELILTIMSA